MSDYEITKRRVIKSGKQIQYSAGGSRVQYSKKNDDMVSKVGKVTEAEVHATASSFIPPVKSPLIMKRQIEQGVRKVPEGMKFVDEFDEQGRWQDNWGRWWTRDSEVIPGDIIQIADNYKDDWFAGERAIVKNVRGVATGRISAVITSGQQTENTKIILERGEYTVIKRSIFEPISRNDYISRDLTRTDIIREDT